MKRHELEKLSIKELKEHKRSLVYGKTKQEIAEYHLTKAVLHQKINSCPHTNTIDVGDSDHSEMACTECKRILSYAHRS